MNRGRRTLPHSCGLLSTLPQLPACELRWPIMHRERRAEVGKPLLHLLEDIDLFLSALVAEALAIHGVIEQSNMFAVDFPDREGALPRLPLGLDRAKGAGVYTPEGLKTCMDGIVLVDELDAMEIDVVPPTARAFNIGR